MAGVAYAVVHSDPPDVYLADDIHVLERLLALKLVAGSEPHQLPQGVAATLRNALLDERWGDALYEWIEVTGMKVDVYTSLEIHTADRLPPDLIGAQLQFTPLFKGAS